MTQLNNEFEKWFDKQLDNENAFTSDEPICKQAWIAAKADSESILKQQQNTIAELIAENKQIDVLREALEEASIFVDNHSEDWYKSGQVLLIKCKQALASTPAQSLQAHDDKVIERVVTLLKDSAWDDGTIDMSIDDLIEDVRGLKRNEFSNSANLDVYNSIIFSDGIHGTMIMESKIVKWLCRNRAKDYFYEMVEGK
jgi:hypothetical protein